MLAIEERPEELGLPEELSEPVPLDDNPLVVVAAAVEIDCCDADEDSTLVAEDVKSCEVLFAEDVTFGSGKREGDDAEKIDAVKFPYEDADRLALKRNEETADGVVDDEDDGIALDGRLSALMISAA